MKLKILSPGMVLFAGLILVLFTSACASRNAGPGQAAPVANITSPVSGSSLTKGQEILITFNAADVKGIAQIELSIDGQPVMVEPVNPPVNSYTASHRWTASTVGSHLIELRAFNVDQEASQPVQLFITVLEAAGSPQATPTAAAVETPTTVIEDTPTPLPSPTATPAPVETPTETPAPAGDPTVTMLTGLNVRLGPSTDYPVIGRLAQGATARITGRNESSTWWQIEFNSDQGNRGWVSGSGEYSTAANTGSVAVVQPPPLPAVAAATPTPTPVSAKPTIYTFTADRYTITRGESVTLRWDLTNAKAAFLRYDNAEEGVVAPGSKTVSPSKDTKYTLIARNDAGETIAEISLKVTETAATPVPIFRDGKIRITNGQFVDFDQGLLQSEYEEGADFQWDAQQRQFFPQSGAAGALLSRSYSDITLDECRRAEYNKPISGIDGSTQITGCYITDEGRYGKFFVSEWDLAGNLTIEWATWNFKQ